MKILVVGNGAREHAIVARLAEDSEVYALMSHNNPAIRKLCKETWICDINDAQSVKKTIDGKKFDLGFSSPDATLAAGVSDVLKGTGMAVASPTQSASRIEWDKAFMRALVDRHKIQGALGHRVVRTLEDARSAITDLGEVAIKPLGLTGGKGVRMSGEHFFTIDDGLVYADSLLKKDGSVLIEEKAEGEEFSFQAFCDGSTLCTMPPVQDHKRAYDGDVGPNTGGMGSYTTGENLPFLSKKDLEQGKKIMKSVISAMKKDGYPFVGVLYGQFMACKDGLRIIEFNARFGDPEAMNVLALLEVSLSETLQSMADGKLKVPKFSSDSTVVKYLVPQGYPDKPIKNAPVNVDKNKLESSGAQIYYAAVYEENGAILTTGSRGFGILGRAKNITEAEQIAEKGCQAVDGNLWHRKDIGTPPLINKRLEHMKKIRG